MISFCLSFTSFCRWSMGPLSGNTPGRGRSLSLCLGRLHFLATHRSSSGEARRLEAAGGRRAVAEGPAQTVHYMGTIRANNIANILIFHDLCVYSVSLALRLHPPSFQDSPMLAYLIAFIVLCVLVLAND